MTAARATALGCAAVLTGTVLTARALLVLVTVEGRSMEPGCHDGDRMLVLRRPFGRLRRGRVAVLRGPVPPDAGSQARSGPPSYIIKRLAALGGQPVPQPVRDALGSATGELVPHGALVVLGDNAEHSSDSREWGFVPEQRVTGVVLCRIARAGAAQPERVGAQPTQVLAAGRTSSRSAGIGSPQRSQRP